MLFPEATDDTSLFYFDPERWNILSDKLLGSGSTRQCSSFRKSLLQFFTLAQLKPSLPETAPVELLFCCLCPFVPETSCWLCGQSSSQPSPSLVKQGDAEVRVSLLLSQLMPLGSVCRFMGAGRHPLLHSQLSVRYSVCHHYREPKMLRITDWLMLKIASDS